MRIFAGADFHCGHFAGLTPPEFRSNIPKIAHVQEILWDFYMDNLNKFKPFDIAILPGDLVDGSGYRSGSTEQFEVDRHAQGYIASRCIEEIGATEIHITYGTPYHTGEAEDFEINVAQLVDARSVKSHLFLEVNGKIFDVKHKIASSSVPYGSLTPLAREITWNQLIATTGEQPRADVLIRAHTHKFDQIDHDGCLGFILPGLQGFGSKYGKRQVSRSINFGFLVIDVSEEGIITWEKVILPGQAQKVEIISCRSTKQISLGLKKNAHRVPSVVHGM